MPESFQYDVFLSHSYKDKDVVRPLAERLRKDGLSVWFDEWEIRPGDSIPAKIEEGLEQSRVLLLCMSANAFGSDWAQLESGTFRFRDPLNKERRFIPLRLDETPIKGSLSQFLHINWLSEVREQEYVKLLEACHPSGKRSIFDELSPREQRAGTIFRLASKTRIWDYCISPDGRRVLTAGDDKMIRLWDSEKRRVIRVLKGHSRPIQSLAWSADMHYALSGSDDGTLRLWNVESGLSIRVFEGHQDTVYSIAWSTDQRFALSSVQAFEPEDQDVGIAVWDLKVGRPVRQLAGHTGNINKIEWDAKNRYALSSSNDQTVRLWDVAKGRCLKILEGHTDDVWDVAWKSDGEQALSGSMDRTIRLWDLRTGDCLRVLEGHTGGVNCVEWSLDCRHALSSGSEDHTLRLWDVETGRCLCVLKGHKSWIQFVAWSGDQTRAFSGDEEGEVRVWDLAEVIAETRQRDLASAATTVRNQVLYTNAKVLLVGDSGVGKTGLARYLALNVKDQETNSSTDGAWANQWTIPHTAVLNDEEREIWLWDFAGQVDYRLVHQLFMDDTAAAVLVFNPQNPNPFEGLGQWDRDLHKATRKPFAKLLAAGRIDRGGLVVSSVSMERFIKERGFSTRLHATSAKTGEGCDALREAVLEAINWQSIPKTTSPALYHRMKQEILSLRDNGLILIRLAELKQRMQLTLLGESFKLEELETVISLLAGPGMIQSLDFGGFILLRPEILSRYAAAVIRKVRKHPQELGCIGEDEMLAGALDYQDFERLPRDQEATVLRTLHETLVGRAWCLRQVTDGKTLLTFPSYFRRERPVQPSHPSVMVTYRFSGPADDIYATLVVRLHHSEAFETDQLWQYAADFKTQTGKGLGLKLGREAEGAYSLELYFNPDVDENSRVLFTRYVHNHLTEQAQNVVRVRHYACGNKKCPAYGETFLDHVAISAAISTGDNRVFCPRCGKPILLRDAMEKRFESPQLKEQARQMQVEVQQLIDNESRELILVGHAFAITGEAGQIYRGFTNSDHGIDGEIEFKNNDGAATGKRLYLQLKSGDSYLTKRQRDGAEIFQIKKARWAKYWQDQAYPVMLVIRNFKGEIRWMDVTAYLKRTGSQVKQIVFEGERFDVMSVRRLRKKILGQGLAAEAGNI